MNILGGYTGFVGSNLLSFADFDLKINSSNTADAVGASADLLVWCGVRAEKWKANKEPAEDRRHVEEVAGILKSIKAKRAILISTVDVYPDVSNGTEATDLSGENHAYGANRKWLEDVFLDHFTLSQIVRLPAIFGRGLKKNFIFDLLNGKDVSSVHSKSEFQFYCLDWLSADLSRIKEKDSIKVINLAVEPITTRDVAERAFGFKFDNETGSAPVKYNLRSEHSKLWGRGDGYLRGREEVLCALENFVSTQRAQK